LCYTNAPGYRSESYFRDLSTSVGVWWTLLLERRSAPPRPSGVAGTDPDPPHSIFTPSPTPNSLEREDVSGWVGPAESPQNPPPRGERGCTGLDGDRPLPSPAPVVGLTSKPPPPTTLSPWAATGGTTVSRPVAPTGAPDCAPRLSQTILRMMGE